MRIKRPRELREREREREQRRKRERSGEEGSKERKRARVTGEFGGKADGKPGLTDRTTEVLTRSERKFRKEFLRHPSCIELRPPRSNLAPLVNFFYHTMTRIFSSSYFNNYLIWFLTCKINFYLLFDRLFTICALEITARNVLYYFFLMLYDSSRRQKCKLSFQYL